MDIKVPKDKHISRWIDQEDGLIERTSSMLDEIESRTDHSAKEGDQ